MADPHRASSGTGLDVDAVRADFPVLERQVHGHPLVYLDTAASAQRPRQVIEAMDDYYRRYNANIHRGVHTLSQEATEAFEQARRRVAEFINAPAAGEVVFTRGTTESINLVAQSFARPRLAPGDEVLITHMEHHSNIVPWQILCEQTGAELQVAPINDRGELEVDTMVAMMTEQVRMIGIVHVSNALGTVNPVAKVCHEARQRGIPVLVDGAQATPHMPVDVQALGCDFYCFSGHKMYGPTGIGALWAPLETLVAMPPYQGGGEMISVVSFEGTTYNEPPAKFEAGTPHIAGGIGLGAAVDYLESLGMDNVAASEAQLLDYATESLSAIEGLRIVGTARAKAGVISFTMDGIHPNDIGTIIDHYGVAIRTGHHCAMPAIRLFGLPATARVSLGIYNTRQEIDRLVEALISAARLFA
ncbi:MAG: SufS family cysteine desulfurase [Xanthomonadales bacterium]|nr:SufS family cysteine desulfurase [Xanthomonadales bacterium]NIN58297.1 SufS family cysteine desulfurase [Xanthomonadales bacterium]NIN73642.1 SufS family cysteine desulfurase [Xanthomonadales bacterium]NIO14427.1 SufS family cysteine desulfurase [Xanthomonadales bacterium]NIP10690.1 SufS family cysteine desulfurase [Xanthomonadales bacterium]